MSIETLKNKSQAKSCEIEEGTINDEPVKLENCETSTCSKVIKNSMKEFFQ